jgi:hypothetical protein
MPAVLGIVSTVAGSGTRTPRPTGRLGSRPRFLCCTRSPAGTPKGGADDGATHPKVRGVPAADPKRSGESSYGHAPRTHVGCCSAATRTPRSPRTPNRPWYSPTIRPASFQNPSLPERLEKD